MQDMSLKKIGHITLYDYNYGSALQCYALQSYLKQQGYACELLSQRSSKSYWGARMRTALQLAGLCLRHPTYAADILRNFSSQRAKNLTLTPQSCEAIKLFIRASISKKDLSWSSLCKLGKDASYHAFLVGSDQVWNGARVLHQEFYFLRFAPKEKRVAYAPSFGGNEIQSYNRSKYEKYLSEFSYLSAREKTGADLIAQVIGKEIPVLADPVCLLPQAEWMRLISQNHANNDRLPKKPFLLAFFLDAPSKAAIQGLQTLQTEYHLPIISFGYRYDVYDGFSNYRHVDGSPWEFLHLINEAATVCTDSFHATVFSLLFHTEFYTYSRCYQHKQNQSTRVTDLLENTSMLDRFDPVAPSMTGKVDFSVADAYISILRERSALYLRQVLEGLFSNDEFLK